MKCMKYMRYIKFVAAILFFELMLGRICYEYGYRHSSSVSDIWTMYAFAVYGLAYIVVCFCQGWKETYIRQNVFSTVFIGIPYLVMVICVIVLKSFEVFFATITFIVLGIALILEIVLLIIQIRQDNIIKKRYNIKSVN